MRRQDFEPATPEHEPGKIPFLHFAKSNIFKSYYIIFKPSYKRYYYKNKTKIIQSTQLTYFYIRIFNRLLSNPP